MEFLARHGITVIDWPSYSPDLNPIEHVWKALKDLLHKTYPNLQFLKDNEADRATFRAAILATWEVLDQAKITSLVESVERRLKAVRDARGFYTKY